MKIFLIHGWGGSKKSLESLKLELSQKTSTEPTLLEMPGFGSTAEMEYPWNLDDYSKWLKNFVKNENEYILVGHSFGGKIIINSLIKEYLSPKQVFLINTSGIRPKNSFKKSFWKQLSKSKNVLGNLPGFDTLRSFTYKRLIGERDYFNSSGNLKETFKIINNQHFTEDMLDLIKSRTHIIWGEKDSYVPTWMAYELHKSIPNSTLDVVEGATHNLPIKHPKKVAELIVKYINE